MPYQIIIVALASVSVALVYLYQRSCDDARRDREEAACYRAAYKSLFRPLDADSLLGCLRSEESVTRAESRNGVITFECAGDLYQICCDSLPRFFYIHKGWRLEGSGYRHTDILVRAARETTGTLVMVKAHVGSNGTYDFRIVAADRTEASFSENFSQYIGIFLAAERRLDEVYWRIVREEYPEECAAAPEQVLQ